MSSSRRPPLLLYSKIAEAVQQKRVSFSKTKIFLLDEYVGLPADDPGLCANSLKRNLISKIDLPEGNFFIFDPFSNDLDQMCRSYDRLIGEEDFDIVLVGLGLNGHIGMNEPGSDLDSPTRVVDLHPSTIETTSK